MTATLTWSLTSFLRTSWRASMAGMPGTSLRSPQSSQQTAPLQLSHCSPHSNQEAAQQQLSCCSTQSSRKTEPQQVWRSRKCSAEVWSLLKAALLRPWLAGTKAGVLLLLLSSL